MENPFPRERGGLNVDPRFKAQSWFFTVFEPKSRLVPFLEWLRVQEKWKVLDLFYGVELAPTTENQHAHMGVHFQERLRFPELRSALQQKGIRVWMAPMKASLASAWKYAIKDHADPANPAQLETTQGITLPMICAPTLDKWRRQDSSFRSEMSGSSNKRSQNFSQALSMVVEGRMEAAMSLMGLEESVKNAPKLLSALQFVPPRKYRPLLVWLYGPSGSGKTALIQALVRMLQVEVHFQSLASGEDIRFWNGYSGQEILVLDDPRQASLSFEKFLQLVNHAPFTANVKNSFVAVSSPLIIVTTPEPPWRFWNYSTNQTGTNYDLYQIQRRVMICARMTSTPMFHLTEKKLMWTNTYVGEEPSLPEEAHLRTLLSQEDVCLPEGWSRQVTGPQSVNRLLMPNGWCVYPVRRVELKLSVDVPQDVELPSEEWRKRVRLPAGLSNELQQKLKKSLSEEQSVVSYLCVLHRNVETEVERLLELHYFGDFFR